MLLYFLQKYINIKKKNYQENYFSKLFQKINDIINNALTEVYGFIINSLFSNAYDFLSLIAQNFYKNFKDISETFFLFILFIIRFIVLTCFLIDVFVFFRLEYMYKALYLFCISLLIKVLFLIILLNKN